VAARLHRSFLLALALYAAAVGAAVGETLVRAEDKSWVSEAGRDHQLVGQIFDVGANAVIDESALIRQIRRAKLVLLGEKHDNADHHRLQAGILRQIAGPDVRATVVMEMINPDQLPALRAHRRRLVNDVGGLRAILDWDRTGWPKWQIYEPIFAVTVAGQLVIAAGNLTRAEIRKIGREGYPAISNERVRRHLMAHPATPTDREALSKLILASHCGHASEAIVPRMIAIQRSRDATMAQALIVAAQQQDRAVLIAGTGHTRTDRGVPRFVRAMGATDAMISVAFMEVRPGRERGADYAAVYDAAELPFDFVWFTPAVDYQDPCKKFRKVLEKMKKKGHAPAKGKTAK